MKMSFGAAVKSVFVNFRKFRGTASRREYWFFVLFTVLLGIVLSTIESIIWPPIQTDDLIEALNQPTPLTSISALVLLIPTLAVTSRRIQDAGWSGKWLFLYLLPIVPLAMGILGVIGYLDSTTAPEVEVLATSVAYFVPTLLIAFAVQLFLLILTLRPTKTREQGNKYAADA
ncbi:unannotated protein [freshwater metagenome]|uniref:Unannotated protein n=1 Tax=freshwater metagenome TaxID=449393 RepID=A0A6J6JL62_9ZZZZ|nr:DUF805 domain-containing protein [Actinomycetota bacterium]